MPARTRHAKEGNGFGLFIEDLVPLRTVQHTEGTDYSATVSDLLAAGTGFLVESTCLLVAGAGFLIEGMGFLLASTEHIAEAIGAQFVTRDHIFASFHGKIFLFGV